MPRYFAYGSNMDEAAMASRCPRSSVLGPAILRGHALVTMSEGYASVVRDRAAAVYGLLWDIAFSDVAALDGYENISGGLYRKIVQPVSLLSGGRAQALIYQALIYIGNNAGGGAPEDDYLETILLQCDRLEFPAAYISHVRSLSGGAARSRMVANQGRSESRTRVEAKRQVRAMRDKDGAIIVRPRFSDPVNRK